ncbi:hypothetical protein [Flavonifractor hominis]|uniref:Uncharacterized protein n=1 Tax=Flavonifractor hominis TaxID=3133178 RepID=A0ABV1ERR3_9FIRM
MGDKLSKNIVVVVLSLLSAVVGIVAFATGMDLPGLLDAVSPSAAQTASPAPSPPQTGGTEEPAGGYTLTAAALEQPDPSSGVYALTGTWKLQGTHEAAASFSQSVEVSPLDDPDQILYCGAASYDTVWSTSDDGSAVEVPAELDAMARYDYPSGTYGTFRVDLSAPPIPAGRYECRLILYIDGVCYTCALPFDVSPSPT